MALLMPDENLFVMSPEGFDTRNNTSIQPFSRGIPKRQVQN